MVDLVARGVGHGKLRAGGSLCVMKTWPMTGSASECLLDTLVIVNYR